MLSKSLSFAIVILALVFTTSKLGANQAPPMGMPGPAASQPIPDSPQPSASPTPPATAAAPPMAGAGCCGSCCQPQLIEQTCYTPTPFHEKRTVQCVEFRTEQRAQQVTIMRAVPEKQTITQNCVVMVPETRTRTENYTACKAVPCENPCGCCGPCCKYVQEPRTRVIQYTVCIPHTEQRSYDITVCKYVPEQRNVTINVCVPFTVEKEVDVCVYRLVAHKVMVPAPTCCCMPPCCGCGPSCGGWNSWGWGWGCGW